MGASMCEHSSTPILDVKLLMCHVLDISHEQLLIRYDETLSPSLEEEYFLLVRRRAAMEPIAYILGKQEFYSRSYKVNSSVLIPRPETELLINLVLEDWGKDKITIEDWLSDKRVKILDLGTGSGIIAITLAILLPFAEITAIDYCPNALKIAYDNAKIHQVEKRISFIQSNWFDALENTDFKYITRNFDYIVSNPPYIDIAEQNLVADQTHLFEPHLALYAGGNGLDAYKQIIYYATKFLNPNGKLVLELGYNQEDSVKFLLRANKFKDIVSRKDIAGYNRAIIATSRNSAEP